MRHDGLVTGDERKRNPLPARLNVQVAVAYTACEDVENVAPGGRLRSRTLAHDERLTEALEDGRKHAASVARARPRPAAATARSRKRRRPCPRGDAFVVLARWERVVRTATTRMRASRDPVTRGERVRHRGQPEPHAHRGSELNRRVARRRRGASAPELLECREELPVPPLFVRQPLLDRRSEPAH